MSSAAAERFNKFDFDNDARWKEYLNAVTFPPGRDDLVLKFKAKWYKREIEPEFDINEVIAAPSGVEKPATTTSTSTTKPAPSTTAPPPPSSSAPPSSARNQPQFIDLALLAGHILLFTFCCMAIQPFNPFLAMKGMAYCNKISLPIHMVRLYRKVGSPTSLSAGGGGGGGGGGLSTWFKNVSRTTESFHIFLISMASSNPSAWAGIIPVAILALYHISATSNSLFSKSTLWTRIGADKVHRYLAVHQQNALQAMAIIEIGTFFSVILTSPRKGPLGLLAVYAFAAQLRMRFWSPESRVYHVNGWRRLGETVKPVLSRVGFAQTIANKGVQFFESGRPNKEE